MGNSVALLSKAKVSASIIKTSELASVCPDAVFAGGRDLRLLSTSATVDFQRNRIFFITRPKQDFLLGPTVTAFDCSTQSVSWKKSFPFDSYIDQLAFCPSKNILLYLSGPSPRQFRWPKVLQSLNADDGTPSRVTREFTRRVEGRAFWFSDDGLASLIHDGSAYSLGERGPTFGYGIEAKGIGLVEDALFFKDTAIVWWHEYGVAAYKIGTTIRREKWCLSRFGHITSIALASDSDAVLVAEWHRDHQPEICVHGLRISTGEHLGKCWLEASWNAQMIPKSDSLLDSQHREVRVKIS